MHKLAPFRVKNAEIYAFLGVNFHFCLIHACVKELTNIMSGHASLSSRQSLSLSTMNKIYTTLQKFVRACVQVCVFACVVIYAKVLPGSVL